MDQSPSTPDTPKAAVDCSVLVPTLGQSPHFSACLRALWRCRPAEILVMIPRGLNPTTLLPEDDRDKVSRWVEMDRGGFSAANNAGLRLARSPWIATVNDDAVVEDGWLGNLLSALAEDPTAGSAQGVNLRFDTATLDGYGIGWNHWYQAVQLGHGQPAAHASIPKNIFGVSATAAVYRRSALDAVALDHGPFDERLFAYYEDVDLAARLRAAGWSALCVEQAKAKHAGSVSGRRLPFGGRRLIHGNRHLILARLLGRAFWLRWPKIALRDVLDMLRALSRGDVVGALGIAGAASRVLKNLPSYAGRAAPAVDLRSWMPDGASLDPIDRKTL